MASRFARGELSIQGIGSTLHCTHCQAPASGENSSVWDSDDYAFADVTVPQVLGNELPTHPITLLPVRGQTNNLTLRDQRAFASCTVSLYEL